ncbi:MAG: tRNA adenosine deaminase-associated protein [Corynebacterium nuruki]|jgi:putative tRNA adenosine deaminase-associated protein|nr:tRNA adenosine deaminase-associated protein [Corynebacterium nuruki]
MSGFVLAAELADGAWRLRVLQRTAPTGLAPLLRELRGLRAEGVLLGLVCVDDDWGALVRPVPGGARLLIGDATVASEDPDDPEVDGVLFARDVLDDLGVEPPTDEEVDGADDPDAPWPEGDFDLLEDIGVGSQLLAVVFDDPDMYASEQLLRIAEELGFDSELAEEFDELLGDWG